MKNQWELIQGPNIYDNELHMKLKFLRVGEMWSTLSLPLLKGPLNSREEIPVRTPSMVGLKNNRIQKEYLKPYNYMLYVLRMKL